MAANIRFNLKESNSKSETLIYLIFRFQGNRLKYSTGQKIFPKFWNTDKNRAKSTRQFPNSSDLNMYLDKLEETVLSEYRSLISLGKKPTIDKLKESLNLVTFRTTRTNIDTLFGFIENFIQRRKDDPQISNGTVKVYQTTYNTLVKYGKEKRKKLDFDNIDLDFLDDFTKWLFAAPRNFSNNYVHKLVRTLKTFLRAATEANVNSNFAYTSKKFTVKENKVDSIYLSIDELTALYHFDFSDNPKIERVRDLFLVGAFTGLRFSDFTNIKNDNLRTVKENEYLYITTQKTKEKVVIPLHSIVKSIFEKYEAAIPRPLTNQKMNEYLKEMGQLAGIDENIMQSKTKGGQQYQVKKKKYQLITTHTARRSFATNAYKLKMPVIAIMQITGHKSETAFLKYIKVSKEENAIMLSDHSFFNNVPLKAVK